MRAWAVVVAAGSGARFGGPKQFLLLGGRPVVAHAVAAAGDAVEAVVLVVPPTGPVPEVGGCAEVVTGGATRSESVRAGLAAIPADVDVVVVHDGARPLATTALFGAVLDAVAAGADAAVPGLPVVDTVKRVDGPAVTATVDRSQLVTVQTPQAFRTAILRAVHAAGSDATDDAALVEAAGGRVVWVPGEPDNFKITTPADLDRAAWVLERR